MIPCDCSDTASAGAAGSFAARVWTVHHQHATGDARRVTDAIRFAVDSGERWQDADRLRKHLRNHESGIAPSHPSRSRQADRARNSAPHAPQMPKPPQLGIPGMPGAPTPPPMTSVDLGKGVIEGHAVVGQQFTFHMPTIPKPPGAQPLPGMPQAPGAPAVPGAPPPPGTPKPPGMPTVAQVWTSTSLHLPVLTTITGSFGQRTCYCKNAPTAEPHPSTFQIPAGYSLAK